MRGFDAKVIAYDKYKSGFGNEHVTEVSMSDIFRESDIVSLHIPLTEETNYLVSKDFIRSFEKNIYLINTSRGKVLRVKDLVEAIESGKVLGACLDVLEFEGLSFENIDLPEEFHKLTQLDNVVLSPHIAGWTHESNFKLAKVLVDKVSNLYK